MVYVSLLTFKTLVIFAIEWITTRNVKKYAYLHVFYKVDNLLVHLLQKGWCWTWTWIVQNISRFQQHKYITVFSHGLTNPCRYRPVNTNLRLFTKTVRHSFHSLLFTSPKKWRARFLYQYVPWNVPFLLWYVIWYNTNRPPMALFKSLILCSYTHTVVLLILYLAGVGN